MKYLRITDGLNRVGNLIPETDNPYSYVKDQDKDWYLSLYKYSEEQKLEVEQKLENGRLKGVSGINDVTTTKLVFDVDSENNLDAARVDAVTILDRLNERGIEDSDIVVSFSGGKGFSVVVNHDQELTPLQHKTLATEIAGDLDTFDTKIYNASRIFRLDFTKHNKTDFYKTPISINQLRKCGIGTIKNLARDRKKPKFAPNVIQLPDVMKNFKKEKKKKEPRAIVQHALDFSKKPNYLTDVKYALHQGYIPPGHGNEGMMILAATYKHVGMDSSDAYHMLQSVNEKRSKIYDIPERSEEEIIGEVVDYVYGDHWNGGTYGNEVELVRETCETFGIVDKSATVNIGQIRKRFINFAENINKNVIKTGIKGLDDKIMITTGMMVGILAAPSAGKTSLATKIVENLSKNDQNVLFLSLDMHDNLLYSRLLQRVSGLNIEKKLRSKIETDTNYNPDYSFNTDEELENAYGEVDDVYKNVEFDFTRGCTIESIEENIKAAKSIHGENLKMVVVDYLEKVRGPFSDATANSGYVASRLSDLGSTYDVAIILLLQPQKSAGDPSEELLSMRKVKGASVIEQDCRVILTLWRPGFSPKDSTRDKYASIAVVKNNMGAVTQVDFGWDGLKGEFAELSKEQRSDLKLLREDLVSLKDEEKKDSSW